MKCVPLTISYQLCFLCISKVSNMLHHSSIVRVHSKDKKNAALYWYTYTFLASFFCCFFSSNIYIFIIFIFFIFFIFLLLLLLLLLLFFWRSIKFQRQNIKYSSKTGNITVSVTAWMAYFRKTIQVGDGWVGGGGVAEDMGFLNKMWKFQEPGKGIYKGWSIKNHAEFPRALDIGLEISKGCNTSFGNSTSKASFCPEFLWVK